MTEELRASPPEGTRATWWHGATAGTTYWRCQVPARHLPGQALGFTTADVRELEDGTYEFPWQRGPAIWQFVGNVTRATLAATMQEQGTPILMEVDDNYLVSAQQYGVNSTWRDMADRSGKIVEDESVRELHARYVEWFDGVICSTPYLAEQYQELNPNVHVCPNSVDPDDWPAPEKPDDGILRIGWAASSSHALDAPLVKRALKWASQQDDVEVYVFGDKFFSGFKYTHIPWTDDLADYRRSLGILDVGVCPLRDTPWSRGKSDVKALEYAMAGALPVVSMVEPYRPWFDEPCLLASNRDDWEAALRWCVSHRDEVPDVAASAKEYVLEQRTIQQNVCLWEEAISVNIPTTTGEGQ